MSKITAIEWLIKELQKSKDYQRVINEVNQGSSAIRDVISEAKEIEKKQIVDAYIQKRTKRNFFKAIELISDAEKYYNETYEK